MGDLFTEPIPPRITVRLRLGTMLLDHAIICLACIPAIIFLNYGTFSAGQDPSGSDYLMFPAFVIYFCKDIVHGRSIAKRILKLSVVDFASNTTASPIQTVIRNLSIIIWPVEVLVACFNQERRMGDIIARTKLSYLKADSLARPTSLLEIAGALVIAVLFTVAVFFFFSKLY